MRAACELSWDVGRKPACEALEVPRATFYRHLDRQCSPQVNDGLRSTPPLSLTQVERRTVIDILHSERFQDRSPYEAYATLQPVYLRSFASRSELS